MLDYLTYDLIELLSTVYLNNIDNLACKFVSKEWRNAFNNSLDRENIVKEITKTKNIAVVVWLLESNIITKDRISIKKCCLNGNIVMFDFLNVYMNDDLMESCIMNASRGGRLEMIKHIEQKYDPDFKKIHCLMSSVILGGNYDLVKYLVDKGIEHDQVSHAAIGASSNIRMLDFADDSNDINKTNLLIGAIKAGNIPLLDKLLKDYRPQSIYHGVMFINALTSNNIETMEYLLNKGFNFVNTSYNITINKDTSKDKGRLKRLLEIHKRIGTKLDSISLDKLLEKFTKDEILTISTTLIDVDYPDIPLTIINYLSYNYPYLVIECIKKGMNLSNYAFFNLLTTGHINNIIDAIIKGYKPKIPICEELCRQGKIWELTRIISTGSYELTDSCVVASLVYDKMDSLIYCLDKKCPVDAATKPFVVEYLIRNGKQNLIQWLEDTKKF